MTKKITIDKRDFPVVSSFLIEGGHSFQVYQKGGGFVSVCLDETVGNVLIEQIEKLCKMDEPKQFEVLVRVYMTVAAKNYDAACSLTNDIAECIENAIGADSYFDTIVDVTEINEEVSRHD